MMSGVNNIGNRDITLHIGLDDTDNPKGDCTTFFATQIVEFLFKEIPSIRFQDYPNLIRLMPNIPYKTRGNAAVAIRIQVQRSNILRIIKHVQDRLTEIEIVDENTNPAAIFLEGNIPPEILTLGEKALHTLIPINEVKDLVQQYNNRISVFIHNGDQGMVGALAAIGSPLLQDHTYELLTYRTMDYVGTPRLVDKESVMQIDKDPNLLTFNNIDPTSKRLLLTPHGPDPILFGVRGESRKDVYEAFTKISTGEPIAKWMVFRSNQGTDLHLKPRAVTDVREFEPAIIIGKVKTPPTRTLGGHVFFIMQDKTGDITLAAYEPSKSFRDVIMKLRPQDEITAYGSVRKRKEPYPLTLNLEKLLVRNIGLEIVKQTPKCPECQVTLSSMGTEKGYRCPKCRKRYRDRRKIEVKRDRDLNRGLYIPPPTAQRHLTKPFIRYGREKKIHTPQSPQEPWNSFH